MKYQGFTLIEIIVVTAVITLIGAFMIPISVSQIYYSKAESIANVLASSIYSQQQNAYNGYLDSEYGVIVQSGKIIMYTGPSYAQNTASKEINTQNVVLSEQLNSGTEIHFNKNSLKPSNYGTIYSNFGDVSIPIILNSEGMVTITR